MTRIEYETRLYRKGDEDRIIPLLELVFGSWPRFDLTCSKREHWIWKFVDTPTGLNEVFVAETPYGEIIGASMGQIKRVKIGDEVVLSRKGAVAAVNFDSGQGSILQYLEAEGGI